MRRLFGVPLALLAAVGVFMVFGGSEAVSGGVKGQFLQKIAKGQVKAPVITTKAANGTTVTRKLPFVSDGTIQSLQDALGVKNGDDRLEGADATPGSVANGFSDIGGAKQTLGCAKRNSDGNVRVNQDCSFRRQAEEDVTYNPADPSNIVGGQNDSRVGYNQCGIDFSTDNGKTWGDMLPPFRQHENAPEFDGPSASNPNDNSIQNDPGTLHTYDAASDPANAVDSQGRAYFSCVIFDVFSNANGLFVTQSPAGAEGSFYFNVPSSIAADPTKNFLVVEDNPNGPYAISDKNFIAADRSKRTASHPTGDNVYVTWTEFLYDANGNFRESPIYGSMSTDGALTWSTPKEISGDAPGLCFFGNFFDPSLSPSACNNDQGSDPVVLPNGDVVVTFNNGNTGPGNPNAQQLAVVCHPTGSSSAGTANLNCGTPTKVGDDITAGEPQCDFGRGPEECVPGPYIRTNDYARVTKENTQNNHLYAVWQDYRNGEYDIQMSMSTDGGLTWHETGTVNPDSGLDHYMPATDQSPVKSDRNGVSYYRSERVPNENATPAGGFAPCASAAASNMGSSTDCQPGVGDTNSDYVVAGGTADNTPYAFKVVSPVFPPPDGIQSGFNGDYSGFTINRGEEAHPFWADTRNVDPYSPANGVVHDEDIFSDQLQLPNGKANTGPGRIGRN